eukprot:740017-Karenia_brevis.AAC.1
MFAAEQKLLEYSRSASKVPAPQRRSNFGPYESPNSGGAGSSNSGLATVPKLSAGSWGGGPPP